MADRPYRGAFVGTISEEGGDRALDHPSLPGQPGQSVADAIRRAEEGFVPIIRRAPGFVAYYLIDSGDILTTVSVFRTEAGARRSVEMAAKWLRENLPDFAMGPPEVTTGAARAHTAQGHESPTVE